jgi:hypothetical protein
MYSNNSPKYFFQMNIFVNVSDVWQSSFSAFKSKEDINNFLEKYQKHSNYFELLPNDMIRLTERGRRYCRDLEL